jgi:hypothetical protein
MASKKANAAFDAAERRGRELRAPRLLSAVPTLTSLHIAISEQSGMSSAKYRKHIVVASAPALFIIACGDERCEDGGHDITIGIMQALVARRSSSEGDHACDGTIGTATCGRQIHYELFAAYRPTN